MDTPYLVRFLRRIGRFFTTRKIEQVGDFSTPARQMLTFVWAAEKTFVLKQRDVADYSIPFSNEGLQAEVSNFVATMTERIPASLRQPRLGREIRSTFWNGLHFMLKDASFEVYKDDICLYVASIEAELRETVHKNIAIIS